MGWDDSGDLDPEEVPVPGSRPRRQVTKDAVQAAADNQWDANPRVYRVDGKDTELFTIGALAVALNREVVTVRSWERRGWLPKPVLRAPSATGQHNHRLYSRAFIVGLVSIAKEEGLMKPGALISSTQFPKRAFALFQEVGG